MRRRGTWKTSWSSIRLHWRTVGVARGELDSTIGLGGTGKTIGAEIAIDEGLSAGEQVIVQGIERLRPGVPVQAAPAVSERAD